MPLPNQRPCRPRPRNWDQVSRAEPELVHTDFGLTLRIEPIPFASGSSGSLHAASREHGSADVSLHDRVAVKIVPSRSQRCTPQHIEYARHQARVEAARASDIAATGPHDNIVSYFGLHESSSKHETYQFFEMVDGEDLFCLISKSSLKGSGKTVNVLPSGVDASFARRIIAGIAAGLKHLHEVCGVVHGDVRPENIVVSHDGETVKLVDFGETRPSQAAAESNMEQNTENVAIRSGSRGTGSRTLFEAPDAAHGTDVEAEIYAFGITSYFVVFGRYLNDFQNISASNHWPKLPPNSGGLRDLLSEMLSHRARRLDIDGVLAHQWISAGDGSTTTSTPQQQMELRPQLQRQKLVDMQLVDRCQPPPGGLYDICRRLQNLGLPPQQQQRQLQLQRQLVDRYQPPPGGFGLDAAEVYASMLERERKDAGECRCISAVLYPHALTSSPVVAQCALLCFVSFSCDMNLGYLTYRTVVVDWMCEVRNRRSDL
eukprot:SAG31_NODE_4641_length_3078_cov_5.138301_3_plen_486_part_01